MFTLVIGIMISFMVKEHIYLLMGNALRENYAKEKKKEKGFIITLMETLMKANGKMTGNLEKAFINIYQQENFMKVIGLRELKMAKVNFNMHMDIIICKHLILLIYI